MQQQKHSTSAETGEDERSLESSEAMIVALALFSSQQSGPILFSSQQYSEKQQSASAKTMKNIANQRCERFCLILQTNV
ncbi:MAG: hypothetical protein AB1631_34705 [Acidobacteriota bacterium]